MKLSFVGRLSMALVASLALGLGTTSCSVGTIGYMWVLGQEFNQIAGFKVDQFSGNLTQILSSPWSSNGSVPVSIVVKTGGRYVYVINQGVGGSAAGPGTGQTIALYSVGGDGTLVFEESYQSQGYVSQWGQMDSTGTFLYVVDEFSPGVNPSTGLYNAPNTDGNGAITVFSTDPNTGRLTLITDPFTQVNGVNTPFWEVGSSPIMAKTEGACIYTLNSGLDSHGLQTVTPYSVGTNGTLAFTTTGAIEIPRTVTGVATNITSIAGPQTTGGSFIFLTDAASNVLYGYQSSGSCSLTALNGGTTNLGSPGFFPTTSDPVYSLIDSTGKFLYIINGSTTSTQTTSTFSSISALTINPTNQELQPIIGAPYPSGSGPVCIAEDPSNQYIYTSNHNDGTVTGYSLNPTTGELSDLTKGSTFAATGKASCFAISGSIV